MWVLIYIFSYSVSPAATNDRAEWRLLPTVVFQEFSSEERCKAAKSKIEVTLKEAGDKLKSALDDLKRAGAADPAQIIIAYDVECLPK
jgi:archaellum biogenesis ATPase FlaH